MSPKPVLRETRRYRGVSQEQRRAERRDKLLKAAVEVFGSQGFHATTVRQICAAAGLTERYFYESFKGLEELFGEAYDILLDRLRLSIIAALAASERKPEALARAAMTVYFGSLKRDPHMARILLIEVYGTTHDMDRLYRRGVQDFAEIIRGVITDMFKPGPSGLDPGLIATALVGAAIHLAMRWHLGGYKESEKVMVANCLGIINAINDKLAQEQPSK